jgi:integrase/recombinase XerD
MNWNSSIKGFRAYLLLEKSLSAHTISAYMLDVGKLLEFTLIKKIDVTPDKLTSENLTDFIYYINDLGLEAKSQARIISGVRAFYKFMLLEDMINDDPSAMLEQPKLRRELPDVLSYDEIMTIIESIDLSIPHAHRNRAIIETLYACGLRVSELVTLKLSNFFPDEGFVKVLGKNNKERLVPIGDSAVKYIHLYIETERRHQTIVKGHEDTMFLNRRGQGLTRVMIFTLVKNFVATAGIKKTVSPHTFRHSFATHLVEGGADLRAVQEMLGHESILTTEIYTHIDMGYLRNTIEKFHPLSHKK